MWKGPLHRNLSYFLDKKVIFCYFFFIERKKMTETKFPFYAQYTPLVTYARALGASMRSNEPSISTPPQVADQEAMTIIADYAAFLAYDLAEVLRELQAAQAFVDVRLRSAHCRATAVGAVQWLECQRTIILGLETWLGVLQHAGIDAAIKHLGSEFILAQRKMHAFHDTIVAETAQYRARHMPSMADAADWWWLG